MAPLQLENGRIALDPTTYHLDTVILDQPPQARAVLVDGQDRPRVTADFADFPYLGIWTQAKLFDTNYVCIEPWSTLPDATFVGRELKDKAGIRSLAARRLGRAVLHRYLYLKGVLWMKPEYVNTFGLRKVSDKQGEILEITLDVSYKYMENTVTVTTNGLENIATPNTEQVASMVMNRQSAISLRNLLIQTLDGEN